MDIVFEARPYTPWTKGAVEPLLKGLVLADLGPITPHFLHAQYTDVAVTYLPEKSLIAFRVLESVVQIDAPQSNIVVFTRT
jgi:hypothetical protein